MWYLLHMLADDIKSVLIMPSVPSLTNGGGSITGSL
ncbi:MAG: hypothetical protein Ct9H300mP14_03910 [Gammaproteobacteria bacterium]|nr:MAG: hypothetical protein Ct9H300mP14_03910 [Gammaproteobacteria bacterium]